MMRTSKVLLISLALSQATWAENRCIQEANHLLVGIQTHSRKAELDDAIAQIIKHPPPNQMPFWSCRIGNCIPLSDQLYQALKKRGNFEGELIDNWTKVTISGEKVSVGHSFILEKGTGDPIIIDPTYLQFVRNSSNLKAPPIFVGTRKDLIEFFKKYRDRILPQDHLLREKQIDPEEFVTQMWPYKTPPEAPNRMGLDNST